MDPNLILNQLSLGSNVQQKIKPRGAAGAGAEAFQAILNGADGEASQTAMAAGSLVQPQDRAVQMFAQMGQGMMMPPQGLNLQGAREAQFVQQLGQARQGLYGNVLGENQASAFANLPLAESLLKFRALPVEGPVLNFAS